MIDKRIVYMDGVDYQHELGECSTKVYASIDELKADSVCWEQCGIVKLELTIKVLEWSESQDLTKNFNKLAVEV